MSAYALLIPAALALALHVASYFTVIPTWPIGLLVPWFPIFIIAALMNALAVHAEDRKKLMWKVRKPLFHSVVVILLWANGFALFIREGNDQIARKVPKSEQSMSPTAFSAWTAAVLAIGATLSVWTYRLRLMVDANNAMPASGTRDLPPN